VILDVAANEVAALRADPAQDRLLGKCNWVFLALPPGLRSSQALPNQSGAQIEEPLGTEFMMIGDGNAVENRQRLAKGGSKSGYPRGGRSDDGAGSGGLCAPV
jgi:hypothetical protein